MERDPALWNADLAPTPSEHRTWSLWHVAALWVGMAVCIPTYLLAADMIKAGMSVWQSVFIVALGNVIVLVPMILNAHPGTRYGIPFPVFARAAFGVRGANVPAIARALVACGWFGIQTWIGGGAIYLILAKLGVAGGDALPVLGINGLQLACFAVFWALNVWFIHRGMDSIRWLQSMAAPFLLLAGLALLWWALDTHGTAKVFDQPGLAGEEFWSAFGPFLTGMVGFWATLALNIPDFSRFCRSQRDQIVGQTIALPTTMALFSFIGAVVSMATGLWDPNAVLASFSSPVVVVIGLVALAIATLSTNIAANVVSPANDFSNIAPGKISFRVGGYLTAGIGFAILPWKLTNNYVFGWLNGYGALLGPIAGILVADYWLVRRRVLIVDDLYRRGGAYEYRSGWNHRAIVALVLGVAPNVPGFLHAVGVLSSVPDLLASLYAYTWFVGFVIAGVVYTVTMPRPR
ncbi:MAG: NCS1 family nucleobase:cation symporter-1 [Myxococcota bacterium]|nr:NCS1 family nucleobase:cation symporter-1 [Myxococcota bacterium]